MTKIWNSVCVAENQYLHCINENDRYRLRQQTSAQYKRKYWCQQQEEFFKLNSSDQKQFWRKNGNIGIGNEIRSNIPCEVVLENGEITNNLDSKWKDL